MGGCYTAAAWLVLWLVGIAMTCLAINTTQYQLYPPKVLANTPFCSDFVGFFEGQKVQGLFSLVPILSGVNQTVAGYETWQNISSSLLNASMHTIAFLNGSFIFSVASPSEATFSAIWQLNCPRGWRKKALSNFTQYYQHCDLTELGNSPPTAGALGATVVPKNGTLRQLVTQAETLPPRLIQALSNATTGSASLVFSMAFVSTFNCPTPNYGQMAF
jgi:hypothetical protein